MDGNTSNEKIYTGKPAYRERKLKDYTGSEKPERIKRGQMDIPFLVITLLLLTIGVVMVLSASFARAYFKYDNPTKYFTRQMIFAVSGVAIMFAASRVPVHVYRRFSIISLGVAVLLLIVVLVIGVGEEESGARRWINIFGIMTFQPSEFAKIAVILSFAALICKFKDKMSTFKYGVAPFAAILGVIAILLIKEPHFSATTIICCIGAIMMFSGGTRLFWFIGGGAIVAVAAVIYIGKIKAAMEAGPEAVDALGYASARIVTWLDPYFNADDDGWQIIQSLYAVGSGGITGLGLGQGRQKYLYLPEEHNDFIFSVVCEELGFIGAVLILCLFALFVIRGFWLALHARDRFGSLVITGITSLFAIQVFLNVAVVTNLMPCTGVSLPFFSYGGTALLIQLAEVGIVLSISRDIPTENDEAEYDEGEE